MIKDKIYNEIIGYTKEIRMPATAACFEDEIREAEIKNKSYADFLHSVLQKEYDLRKDNGKKNRIRAAGFPVKKYLEDLKIEELPKDGAAKLAIFKSLDFIKEGKNIILSGSTGTGKSHIAIGLGIKAAMAGYKVLFTSIPLLINQLKEARGQSILRSYELRFEKYDLVIADELGYISFDRQASELLFTHLSLRAGRKSTIITTNLSFDRWEEIFVDPVITAAMTDRLTHKSYIVDMIGPSYRLKETKEWLKEQNVAQKGLNGSLKLI
jgi:DNA replication protein DnaC